MNLINEIEKKYPVLKWKICNIHVWPIVRQILAEQLALVGEREAVALVRSSYTQKMKKAIIYTENLISSYLTDWKSNDCLYQNAQVIFYMQSCRRIWLNSTWYDRYCEPFEEIIKGKGISCLRLECAPRYKYQVPRSSKSVFIQPFIDYAKVKSILKSGQICDFNEVDNYSEFYFYIKSIYPNIVIPNIHSLSRLVYIIQWLANFHIKILRKNATRLCFIQCYESIDGMAFTLACNRLNIPVVEIQQGWQGRDYYPSGRWSNVPPMGYDLLPTYFWVWGNEEAEVINEWNSRIKVHKPIVGGDLWTERWLKSDYALAKEYDEKIKRLKQSDKRVDILITLQYGGAANLAIFAEIIKNAPTNYHWWIRLHPAMMSQRQEIKVYFQGIKNTNIDSATDMPLAAWLRNVDVHMTKFSSSVLEAEKFGVPSIIIDQIGVNCFKQQIISGSAFQAFTPCDIINRIKQVIQQKIKVKYSNTASNQGQDLLEKLLVQYIK